MKFLFLFLISAVPLFSAPASKLIPFWNQSVESSTQSISHAAFDNFLKKNIGVRNGITFVRYSSVSAADKAQLKAYIQSLEAVPILSYSRREQQAYWINLYNAATVALILDNYPVKSIRNIPNRFIPTGPWDIKDITVEGQKISLNNIEHGILRPIWKDYRVHFVVNCASIGCPNLPSQAVTPDNYESLADKAASDYINHPRGARKERNTLIVSSLFDWYSSDFGSNRAEIFQTLSKHANPEQKALLNPASAPKYEYDWALNEEGNIP